MIPELLLCRFYTGSRSPEVADGWLIGEDRQARAGAGTRSPLGSPYGAYQLNQ